MLQIRTEQVKSLERAAELRFEDEMVAHTRGLSPKLCEVLGEEQLRVALRQQMERARTYDFTNRGPVRLFIELSFMFGRSFDTDPQYHWAARALGSVGHQMKRADRLYQRALDYIDKVFGPDSINSRRSLGEISALIKKPLPFTANDFTRGMLEVLTRVFPEKIDYVGEKGMKALVNQGSAVAREQGFAKGRGEALMVLLMFGFGHGCLQDPLYPWIGRTLTASDPGERAERLESKAVIWLDGVVEEGSGGGEAT